MMRTYDEIRKELESQSYTLYGFYNTEDHLVFSWKPISWVAYSDRYEIKYTQETEKTTFQSDPPELITRSCPYAVLPWWASKRFREMNADIHEDYVVILPHPKGYLQIPREILQKDNWRRVSDRPFMAIPHMELVKDVL